MPVCNEEKSIGLVIGKWANLLGHLGIDYEINVYDGNSKDQTPKIIRDHAKNNTRIVVHDMARIGHGPTILLGYKENSNDEWIFQTDSDNEMEADFFEKLWGKRLNYDLLVGKRSGRKQDFSRQLISWISRAVIKMLYGNRVWDVNSPFRLMRSSAFKKYFYSIPDDAAAPNIILSGIASLNKFKVLELPVPHYERAAGASINKWKIFKASLKSFYQTVAFRFNNSEAKNG